MGKCHKGSYSEYLLMFFFLCLGGNPILTVTSEYYAIISIVLLFLVALKRNITLYNKDLSIWIIAWLALFLLQFILLPINSIPADINFLAKFYCGFLIMGLLGRKFRYLYFDTITFIAKISLIFWILHSAGIHLPGIIIGRNVNFIIYNYTLGDIREGVRNCGMFWEPGAFQAYIMLAFLLFIDNLKYLFVTKRKSFIILLLALVSTLSTTAFVIFGLFVFLLVLKKIKNIIYRSVAVFIVVAVSFWAFNSLDFLGDKIKHQYETSQNMNLDEPSWTRFGSAVIDIHQISKRPITGNGFDLDQRYPEFGELMSGAGNGFTGSINIYGIPMMLLYMFFLYKKAPSRSKYEKFIYVVLIILMLNGEYLLNYTPFWSLVFLNYRGQYNQIKQCTAHIRMA